MMSTSPKGERPPAPSSPAEMTRMALIRAALQLFGRQGYDGTSTREIAAAAKANIGSIAYHFGGKEGLRTAVADHIVGMIQTIAQQATGGSDATVPERLEPQQARARLAEVTRQMVAFMVARPEAGEIVQFMLRELSQPTPTLDRIYDGVFAPTHRRLCALWEQATGEQAESERTRLVVFTMIGQVLYFRIGREPVMRRMGWSGIGEAEAAKVAAVAVDNLDAMLAARGMKP